MSNAYYRVCRQLKDKGILVETTQDLFNLVEEGKPLYRSVYTYESKHKEIYHKQGDSVAGINDVKTNFVFLDFDSYQEDLEDARQSALTAVDRLNKYGVPTSDLDICFSGSKGFSITFGIDTFLTQDEYKNFHRALIGDLPGYDSTVVSANRIYRVPYTKHEGSGLYKHPITFKMLKSMTVKEIKAKCAVSPHQTTYEDLHDATVPFNSKLKELTKPTLSLVKDVKVQDLGDLDFKAKIKGLTNCRWAILNGFIPRGNRHNLLMAAAASLKVLNYPKETTYNMLKAANRLADQKDGDGKTWMSKGDIWNTVIKSVYDPSWKNGQYTCKSEGPLRDYCQTLGGNKCNHSNEEEDVTSLDSVIPAFKEYARNADQNVLKTGIPPLDARCKFMAGTSSHILGPPGSGKCLGKGTLVRMFDGSLKAVELIVTGDKLMGDDSTPRNVLGTTTGREEMFRIFQKNGITYEVNKSHILSVMNYVTGRGIRGEKFDIELTRLMEMPSGVRFTYRGYREETEYPEQSVPVHPYMMGIFLSGEDMFEYDKIMEGKVEPIVPVLQEMGVFNNKRIPKEYLINSLKNRKLLLAGLLDGLSNVEKCKFVKKPESVELERDIYALVSSLGARTQVRNWRGSPQLFIHYWDWDSIPTLKTRKNKLMSKKYHCTSTPFSITSIGVGDYYGFEIDGNKRFLLEDNTVTHNTSLALAMLEHNSDKGNPCLFFSLDMNKFNVVTSIARRHAKFTRSEIDVIRDGQKVVDPDIEELVMAHFKNNTKKSQDIEKLILNKYKNVKFCFKPSYHISHIQAAINEASEYFGRPVKMVMIDYSELVNTDVSDPTQASSVVAQMCRHIAIETQTAFITLLQPNKANADVRKELNSYTGAKGSSAIAQSSQLMLSVSRPGFSPKTPENDKFMVVNAVKNRSGALFSVDMKWEGEHGTISSLSDEELYELQNLRERLKEEMKSEKDGYI